MLFENVNQFQSAKKTLLENEDLITIHGCE